MTAVLLIALKYIILHDQVVLPSLILIMHEVIT